MDGVEASKEYVLKMEELQAEKKKAAERKRKLELARTSKPRNYDDGQGTTWVYVLVDDSLARIVNCRSEQTLLVIPDEIEGYQVYAIGPDACSSNDFVTEIICPDSIEFIGSCAFRFCPNLKRVVFPKKVAEFSASWLSHCPNVEEIVLPGRLDRITLSVFDNPGVRRLYVGKHVSIIEPGAFQKTKLETLAIDRENPFITTDGVGVYNVDGSVLLAIGSPVERYEVADGCEVIGKKAAYGNEALKNVVLPESVHTIDEFAFSHSGLTEFTAPSSLETIRMKGFYYCQDLERITLNEGLKTLGNSAFEESSLSSLEIPASIEEIGISVTASTNIVHSGPDCTLSIDDASPSLFLDGSGGLYRREDDGVHLIQLVDATVKQFTAFEGCRVVDDYAFAFHDAIESASFAEGLVSIGKSAFRCCSRLVEVELPDSVEEIGYEAFIDTNLTSFKIPASLAKLGKNALVTQGAHHGDQVPSLRRIDIASGNETFCMIDGMLCRREGSALCAIMFTSSASEVRFPDNLVSIEDYAFNNARGIEYLSINPGLNAIGTAGMTTWCWIEDIHVEVSEPIEGRTTFDFRFPDTRKGIHGISMGLGGASWVNVPGIMAQYDNCVVSAHDYHSPRNPDSIPIYDQVKMILPRLKDPILLTKVNRSMYERLLRNYIVEICVDVARHDDRGVVDDLLELGYVNDDNLEQIISEVGRLQDAAMTGYLLEVKRRQFKRAAFDFDL